MHKYGSAIVEWLQEYEKQVLYLIGLVTIAIGSFVFGAMHGNTFAQEPIVVYRTENEPVVITQEVAVDDIKSDLKVKDCKYVGSIKGKKYYPPSCSYAKKITKENLRCFTSDEDAINKGYERSTSCK